MVNNAANISSQAMNNSLGPSPMSTPPTRSPVNPGEYRGIVEREISIPHETAEFSIENFKFIASERVQVNPYNSPTIHLIYYSN